MQGRDKFTAWGLAVFLIGGPSAQAAEIACPSHQGKAPLVRVSVFDGPPEEQADLVPDRISSQAGRLRSEWKLGHLYDLRRTAHVACWYAGLADPLVIEAAQRTESCVFRQNPGLPAAFRCR